MGRRACLNTARGGATNARSPAGRRRKRGQSSLYWLEVSITPQWELEIPKGDTLPKGSKLENLSEQWPPERHQMRDRERKSIKSPLTSRPWHPFLFLSLIVWLPGASCLVLSGDAPVRPLKGRPHNKKAKSAFFSFLVCTSQQAHFQGVVSRRKVP